MPFLFVLCVPLALVGAVAVSLARTQKAREARERPSIEAAERIARALSGRIEDGRVLRVSAELEGKPLVCSIARMAQSLIIEVAGRTSLAPLHVTLHRISGRELADYAGQNVVLATEGGIEAIWGSSAAQVIPLLPSGLFAAMQEIDASWITVEGDAIRFGGVGLPGSETELPLFRKRLTGALALSRALSSTDTE